MPACHCCTKEHIEHVLFTADVPGTGTIRVPIGDLDIVLTYCPNTLNQVMYMRDKSTGKIGSAHFNWEEVK